VARELTKRFEEFKRGTVAELAAEYSDADPKGEVVLLVAGADHPEVNESDLTAVSARLRAAGKSAREVTEHLISDLRAPRNLAYRIAHEKDS
jgi:16S rRNA (cytidine1402-2'-O)-methyltransferase